MKKILSFLGGILLFTGLKAQSLPPVKKETGQPPAVKPIPDSTLAAKQKAYVKKTDKYSPIKQADKLSPIKQADKLMPIKQTDKLSPIKSSTPVELKKAAAPLKAGSATAKPDKI